MNLSGRLDTHVYHRRMTTIADLERSTRQFAEIANQAFAHEEQILKIARQVSLQLEVPESVRSAIKTYRQIDAETIERVIAPLRKAAEGYAKMAEEHVRAIAAVEASVPTLVVDLPRIADWMAVEVPAMEGFRSMLRQLDAVPIQLESPDIESLEGIRRDTNDALSRLEGPEVEVARQTMRKLEAIDDASSGKGESDHQNVFLTCAVISAVSAVLTLLAEILANQDEIVQNGFFDVTLFGSALARIWPYSVCLLAVLLGYGLKRRR
jgi:hypothetical protein